LSKILAIDPGNVESAYVVLDENLKPVEFGKLENNNLKNILSEIVNKNQIKCVAIEHIANMGMSAVGQTLFTTCIWIGRFTETLSRHINVIEIKEIYRREEKINLCGSMKAKDGNIRQALIDRFGVVGTKKNPGWFYGVSKDVWAAIAVGVTYHDMYLSKKAVG
jgi:hypothetical protein